MSSSDDHVQSYLCNRADRSMLRLCALLWILKLQQNDYMKQRLLLQQQQRNKMKEETEAGEIGGDLVEKVVDAAEVKRDVAEIGANRNKDISLYTDGEEDVGDSFTGNSKVPSRNGKGKSKLCVNNTQDFDIDDDGLELSLMNTNLSSLYKQSSDCLKTSLEELSEKCFRLNEDAERKFLQRNKIKTVGSCQDQHRRLNRTVETNGAMNCLNNLGIDVNYPSDRNVLLSKNYLLQNFEKVVTCLQKCL